MRSYTEVNPEFAGTGRDLAELFREIPELFGDIPELFWGNPGTVWGNPGTGWNCLEQPSCTCIYQCRTLFLSSIHVQSL